MTPLEYIDFWDICLAYLAGLSRLFFVLQYKAAEQQGKGRKFSFRLYFDGKHIIRWTGHALVTLALLLVVPEIFDGYVKEVYLNGYGWSYFGDFVIGFYGYDLVKLLEKISLPLVKRISKIL